MHSYLLSLHQITMPKVNIYLIVFQNISFIMRLKRLQLPVKCSTFVLKNVQDFSRFLDFD